jgi:SAM-dependent methyltransferase
VPTPRAWARKAGHARHEVTRMHRAFGLPGAALSIAWVGHRALGHAGRRTAGTLRAVRERATDAWLGVDTRGWVDSASGLRDVARGGDPKSYAPLDLLWWMRVLAAVPLDPAGSTFVDLGAGRGRVLVLAARMGFRRVIGVELDPRLMSDAQRNVARWSASRRGQRQGTAISVLHADAADFEWPPGPVLVSLFNPFGAETLRRVLDRHRGPGRPGDEVFVAYFNPVHRQVFEEQPGFVLHDRGVDWDLYRLDGHPLPALVRAVPDRPAQRVRDAV